MDKDNLKIRLQKFLEHEARSGSMDYGCITPLYVYRMWGGKVAFDVIVSAFEALKERNDYR